MQIWELSLFHFGHSLYVQGIVCSEMGVGGGLVSGIVGVVWGEGSCFGRVGVG